MWILWLGLVVLIACVCYLLLWVRRTLPSEAAISAAKPKEGGTLVHINGFDIWTKVLGEDEQGSPIVFVPGGLGMKSSYMEEAFQELSGGHPLIFYDPRGCGRSESKAELSHYTWEHFASELEEVIEHYVPAKKVILAAHSGACFILYKYLQKYRDRVEKLILLSCLPLKLETKFEASSDQFFILPPKDQNDANRWFSKKIREGLFLGSMFNNKSCIDFRHIDDITMAMSSSVLVKANKPYDYRGEFKNLDVPVLILTGSDKWESPYTNRKQADLLEKEFKNVRRYSFENSGHFFFLEEKTASLEVIRDFLVDKKA